MVKDEPYYITHLSGKIFRIINNPLSKKYSENPMEEMLKKNIYYLVKDGYLYSDYSSWYIVEIEKEEDAIWFRLKYC